MAGWDIWSSTLAPCNSRLWVQFSVSWMARSTVITQNALILKYLIVHNIYSAKKYTTRNLIFSYLSFLYQQEFLWWQLVLSPIRMQPHDQHELYHALIVYRYADLSWYRFTRLHTIPAVIVVLLVLLALSESVAQRDSPCQEREHCSNGWPSHGKVSSKTPGSMHSWHLKRTKQ